MPCQRLVYLPVEVFKMLQHPTDMIKNEGWLRDVKVVVQPVGNSDQGVRYIDMSFAYRVLNVIEQMPTL